MNKKKSIFIAIFIAILGSALGLYNTNLYGFFALLIAPLYFPLNNPLASRIAALSAFAVGFLVRPIGGLLFGHIGDTYGRKKAFLSSIVLTTMATFIMGILPSYDVIGIAAPLILVCCLAAQGSCIAGTYSGASVLIAEYSKQHTIGFACSLLAASSLIGIGIAAALGAIVTLDSMPTWGWRVPFLFSMVGGILVLSLRHYVLETLAVKEANIPQQKSKYHLIGILKQGRNFFCAIGINAASTAAFYIFTMYIMGLSVNADKSLSPHQSLFQHRHDVAVGRFLAFNGVSF
jgi:MHS family proline/betaine transporter-like MFS transporter